MFKSSLSFTLFIIYLFRLVYIIFYWLGIGTLLPWNMFITVRLNMSRSAIMTKVLLQVVAYWNTKFRTVEVPEIEMEVNCLLPTSFSHRVQVALGNSTELEGPNDLQKAWGGYLAVARYLRTYSSLN